MHAPKLSRLTYLSPVAHSSVPPESSQMRRKLTQAVTKTCHYSQAMFNDAESHVKDVSTNIDPLSGLLS
ncbi:hypothetical protein RRG08_062575 [Elysia crispata]|uniref:Uncharacterized protein n=1 Tax=Elysia crispata TaxID=231223 RepID=A0AAE1AM56_9GAST|nr:hypothetical protein RRG08_062575 [Elysia crispata]